MEIRPATIQDLPLIEKLNSEFFHEKRDFQEIVRSQEDTFFVSEVDKRIVGFSGFHHNIWNNTARIIDIFVHPEFRRQGLASQFIEQLKAEGRRVGVRCLIGEAPSLNPVLGTYLKNGFRICGFNDRYYSNNAREIAIFLSFDFG